jgi:hypothetical protein
MVVAIAPILDRQLMLYKAAAANEAMPPPSPPTRSQADDSPIKTQSYKFYIIRRVSTVSGGVIFLMTSSRRPYIERTGDKESPYFAASQLKEPSKFDSPS